MKCANCGKSKAGNRWTVQVCADKRKIRHKYLCDKHDIKLNSLVLEFMNDRYAVKKVQDYKNKGIV